MRAAEQAHTQLGRLSRCFWKHEKGDSSGPAAGSAHAPEQHRLFESKLRFCEWWDERLGLPLGAQGVDLLFRQWLFLWFERALEQQDEDGAEQRALDDDVEAATRDEIRHTVQEFVQDGGGGHRSRERCAATATLARVLLQDTILASNCAIASDAATANDPEGVFVLLAPAWHKKPLSPSPMQCSGVDDEETRCVNAVLAGNVTVKVTVSFQARCFALPVAT